jgi:serine/threonine protein kinase
MIGSVVGNYKIVDKIGEGGMGAVFKGVDLMLEREVAIKMLRPELAQQPNVVERFRTEAVTLAKLNHPNVATLHSFFRQGDDFFMVMEFVRGETLDSIIRQHGAMPCERAVELFSMALKGIDHAHKMGIVHRDIKPANMMLTDTGSIKVMDFGIARVLGSDRLTRAGHLIGTAEYMSPEQVRGEETDARSDIYSLGILLYEMLTGRVPFNNASEYELMRSQIEDAPTPPRTFSPHVPLGIEQAIMRALAKKREARYQSASEFRSSLLQRTTGVAATSPLENLVMNMGRTGDHFVASRPMDAETKPIAPPSVDVPKETRLAADQGYIPAGTAGQIKATRLGQLDAPAASPQAPEYYAPQPVAPQAPVQASLLSKLNWKHYAGAGGALIAIIALSFAFVAGGSKPPVQAPTVQTSVPSAPALPEPTPAQTAPPASGQPIVVPPPGSSIGQPAQSGASSGSERARDNRSQKNTNAAASVTVEQPSTQEPAHAAQPTPPAKQDKGVASSKPAEKNESSKSEEKKDDKKSGGIGGAIKGGFKKIFGGGDKNKNEKKP